MSQNAQMLKIQENAHMTYYLLMQLNILLTWDLLSKTSFVLTWLFKHQLCFLGLLCHCACKIRLSRGLWK